VISKPLIPVLLILLLSSQSKPQSIVKGSYTIGAICKDGIVVGIDSRMFYKDTKGLYFSVDPIPKIFLVGGCILTITGRETIYDTLISHYVYTFRNSINTNLSPFLLINNFLDFLLTNSRFAITDLHNIQMAAYGFDEGIPKICITNADRPQIPDNKAGQGVFSSDSLVHFGENKKYDIPFCSSHLCKDVAAIITKEIRFVARKYKKQNTIGGEIYLVQLTPDVSTHWLNKEPKFPEYKSVCDIFRDINNKKIIPQYTAHKLKKKIRTRIANCPK
jgi:hypothetical protein